MSEAGERLIEAAKEAVAVARGDIPAGRITIAGQRYVPEGEVEAARLAERERCAKLVEGVRHRLEVAAAKTRYKRLNQIDEHVAGITDNLAAAIRAPRPKQTPPLG